MKTKILKYILYLICGVCAVIFYIRHYTNSKYNVIPPNYVKKYLDETYDMNYEFLEENYYRKNGYHIWEYICQDDEGFIFRMEYSRPTEEEGPVTSENASTTAVYDGFIIAKIKDEFQDQVQWIQGGYTKEYDYLMFEINNESDIGEIANNIVDIFEFSFNYLQHVDEKNKPVVCWIYCMDLYSGSLWIDSDIFDYKDKTRESLYELVYSKLEEKFRKHNENRK